MNKKIFYYLLSFDLFLILLHVLWGESIYIFNLDYERTIPAYYSGLKLIGVSVLAFLTFSLIKMKGGGIRDRVIWFLLGSFFVILAFDEISELHENLGNYFLKLSNNFNIFQQDSFMWLIFLSPIILGVLFLLFYFLFLIRKQKAFIYVLLGIISFFLVLVFEFLGGMIIKSHENWYQIIIVIEEALEKIGATLFFVALLDIFKKDFFERYKLNI